MTVENPAAEVGAGEKADAVRAEQRDQLREARLDRRELPRCEDPEA